MAPDKRLALVRELLASDRALAFVSTLQSLLFPNGTRSRYPEDQPLIEVVAADRKLQQILLAALDALDTPVLKMDWLRFAYELKWVGPEKILKEYYAIAEELFRAPVTPSHADALCSLRLPPGIRIDPGFFVDRLTRSHFESDAATSIQNCLGMGAQAGTWAYILRTLQEDRRIPDSKIAYWIAPSVNSGYYGVLADSSFQVDESDSLTGENFQALRQQVIDESRRVCRTRSGNGVSDICRILYERVIPESSDAYDWAVRNFRSKDENILQVADTIFSRNSRAHLPYLNELLDRLSKSASKIDYFAVVLNRIRTSDPATMLKARSVFDEFLAAPPSERTVRAMTTLAKFLDQGGHPVSNTILLEINKRYPESR